MDWFIYVWGFCGVMLILIRILCPDAKYTKSSDSSSDVNTDTSYQNMPGNIHYH